MIKYRLSSLVKVACFVSVIFIVAGVYKSSILDKSKKSEATMREAKTISHLFFEMYLIDRDVFNGIKNNFGSNRIIFNKLNEMDKLDGIDYMLGSSRINAWIKEELMLDLWGEPFRIKISPENDILNIDIISNGPDRKAGTLDDIHFSIAY